MKRRYKILMLLLCLSISNYSHAQAGIAEAIKSAIVKVIRAIDLKIQRLQNETIRLQNAQKAIENALTKTKLTEISEWVEKQRTLYADYYDELWKVKAAIGYYRNIKSIIDKQKALVAEYERASNLFRNDKHFTSDELDYMEDIYSGIVQSSTNNVDLLLMVVNAFTTQMTDADRIAIINEVADNIDKTLIDLRVFNNSNMSLSLKRTKDEIELNTIRKYYGLE
jgi:hypothetical protein